MRIGVVFPQTELGADPGAVRAFATAASELGFTHIAVFERRWPGVERDRVQGARAELLRSRCAAHRRWRCCAGCGPRPASRSPESTSTSPPRGSRRCRSSARSRSGSELTPTLRCGGPAGSPTAGSRWTSPGPRSRGPPRSCTAPRSRPGVPDDAWHRGPDQSRIQELIPDRSANRRLARGRRHASEHQHDARRLLDGRSAHRRTQRHQPSRARLTRRAGSGSTRTPAPSRRVFLAAASTE